jgi:hypothetical protein
LRIIVDFQLVLREVDIDECIDGDEQVDLLYFSVDLEEDVVLLEDEVVDVFEVAEVQSSSPMGYFFTKDFMNFIVISFSCLLYSLHS